MASTDESTIAQLLTIAANSVNSGNSLDELSLSEIERLEAFFSVRAYELRGKFINGWYTDVFGDGPLSTGSSEDLGGY